MPVFLDPRGRASYGIALCARCSRKFFLEELLPDPNAPGLMVCREDLDVLDPYRLPARQTEQINLPFYRPDIPLTDYPTGVGTTGIGIPTGPGQLPVFNLLAQRLIAPDGSTVLDQNSQPIFVPIPPGPLDLP